MKRIPDNMLEFYMNEEYTQIFQSMMFMTFIVEAEEKSDDKRHAIEQAQEEAQKAAELVENLCTNNMALMYLTGALVHGLVERFMDDAQDLPMDMDEMPTVEEVKKWMNRIENQNEEE